MALHLAQASTYLFQVRNVSSYRASLRIALPEPVHHTCFLRTGFVSEQLYREQDSKCSIFFDKFRSSFAALSVPFPFRLFLLSNSLPPRRSAHFFLAYTRHVGHAEQVVLIAHTCAPVIDNNRGPRRINPLMDRSPRCATLCTNFESTSIRVSIRLSISNYCHFIPRDGILSTWK